MAARPTRVVGAAPAPAARVVVVVVIVVFAVAGPGVVARPGVVSPAIVVPSAVIPGFAAARALVGGAVVVGAVASGTPVARFAAARSLSGVPSSSVRATVGAAPPRELATAADTTPSTSSDAKTHITALRETRICPYLSCTVGL
ncbi:MAG: hypothetical protein GEU68_12680 [Actinobacteria bacterium]|nr:hypothetical protein [Actinomycetota bacterium]